MTGWGWGGGGRGEAAKGWLGGTDGCGGGLGWADCGAPSPSTARGTGVCVCVRMAVSKQRCSCHAAPLPSSPQAHSRLLCQIDAWDTRTTTARSQLHTNLTPPRPTRATQVRIFHWQTAKYAGHPSSSSTGKIQTHEVQDVGGWQTQEKGHDARNPQPYGLMDTGFHLWQTSADGETHAARDSPQ